MTVSSSIIRDSSIRRRGGRGGAWRRARGGGGAFTIIELMVVIAIMVVLMAIAMPAIKSLTSNNNQKQAVNLLTSLLANARAMAIQSHSPAGLVVYEDSTVTLNQSAAQVVIASAKDPTKLTLTYFIRAPRAGAEVLPPGIKIATLDDAGGTSLRTEASVGTSRCRIILFDGNGQMVLRSGLARDTRPGYGNLTDASSVAWHLDATAGGGESNGVSSPGLLIYNSNDLKAAADNGTVTLSSSASVTTWLQNHADIIIVNAYTGNVIR